MSNIKLTNPYITVGVSNRHIHLSPEDFKLLFGENAVLTLKKKLFSGQYAAEQTVTINSEKATIENVRIVAPTREKTQLEISLTDSFKLGITPPINDSGDLLNASEVTIENPNTNIKIKRKCAIVAARHIHLSPEFAASFALENNDLVAVEFGGARKITFDQVKIRIAKGNTEEMHIDTDEANAGNIKSGDIACIKIKK